MHLPTPVQSAALAPDAVLAAAEPATESLTVAITVLVLALIAIWRTPSGRTDTARAAFALLLAASLKLAWAAVPQLSALWAGGITTIWWWLGARICGRERLFGIYAFTWMGVGFWVVLGITALHALESPLALPMTTIAGPVAVVIAALIGGGSMAARLTPAAIVLCAAPIGAGLFIADGASIAIAGGQVTLMALALWLIARTEEIVAMPTNYALPAWTSTPTAAPTPQPVARLGGLRGAVTAAEIVPGRSRG
jgi:hypothetical protein